MLYSLTPAIVAPIIGVALSVTRSLVPIREVVSIRANRRLGEMNPAPYAAMILNHIGWVVYAVLRTDWFIFSADMIGLISGVWITFSLYPLASLKVQNRLNGLILLAATLWGALALVTMILSSAAPDATLSLWSWTVSVTQILLFASPLSTLYKAVVSRNSASFHLGLSIMSIISSAMWCIYGITIKNLFVLVPNLLGALLSGVALGVCILFKRSEVTQTTAQTELNRIQAIGQTVEL